MSTVITTLRARLDEALAPARARAALRLRPHAGGLPDLYDARCYVTGCDELADAVLIFRGPVGHNTAACCTGHALVLLEPGKKRGRR